MRGAELLAAFLPADRCDEFLADLEEELASLRATRGSAAARGWYLRQLAGSFGPVVASWMVRGLVQQSAALAPRRVGVAFFSLAVLWLATVAWIAPFSTTAAGGHPVSDDWSPAAVIVENGRVLPVYAFGGVDPLSSIGTTTLMRFSILALGPPIVGAILLLAGLAIVDMRRNRRMSVSNDALALKI